MTVIDLSSLQLTSGAHRPDDDGVCLLEAAALFAGESKTDHPQCVSPILADFGISLNDNWSDNQRQKLKPFIPRLIGTRDDGHDEARGYLALDWLIRVYAPAWLRLVPTLEVHTDRLANAEQINTLERAAAIGDAVRDAASAASAARAAAGAAAGDAAWDAARAAAWAAARAAAWDAARAAARAAAGDAARAAAWDAARAAAGAAAGDAAWDAARAAAGDALTPTVETLQESALQLFDRMLSVS